MFFSKKDVTFLEKVRMLHEIRDLRWMRATSISNCQKNVYFLRFAMDTLILVSPFGATLPCGCNLVVSTSRNNTISSGTRKTQHSDLLAELTLASSRQGSAQNSTDPLGYLYNSWNSFLCCSNALALFIVPGIYFCRK